MLHQHQWEVLLKTYAPPVPNPERWRQLSNAMVAGLTTAVLRCRCGRLERYEMLGQEVRGVMEIKFKPEEKKA